MSEIETLARINHREHLRSAAIDHELARAFPRRPIRERIGRRIHVWADRLERLATSLTHEARESTRGEHCV